MGKHRRKHSKRDDNNNSNSNSNPNSNSNSFNSGNINDISSLLNNVDMNQLAGMLNNIDMDQVSSMLSGLNSGGNENGNRDPGGHSHIPGDRRVDILNAIRPLMDEERGNFINTVIQLYTISKILKNK